MLRKKRNLKKVLSFLCVLAMVLAFVPGLSLAAAVPPGYIGSNDFLYVGSDGLLYNQVGQEVVLRGFNLGGWMLQESWMCPLYDGPDKEKNPGVNGSYTNLETIQTLEAKYGAAKTQELFDLYQENWITEDDFNYFQSIGVNSLRIPFWYRNFMSDEAGTFIGGDDGSAVITTNPGFKRLDWAIEQARKRGIYVILDLHGAMGGQSTDHCCGTLKKNEVYTNPVYRQATVDLWTAIANRYKNNPVVAAYDLLNEPQNNNGYLSDTSIVNNWAPGSERAIQETNSLYTELYHAIRSVDPETICAFEAIWTMESLPDDAYTRQWDHNVMYSMHLYDTQMGSITQDKTIRYRVNELVTARRERGVAVHVGELNNDPNQVAAYNLYNQEHISWNSWTYKLMGQNMGNWSIFQNMNNSVNCNVKTDDEATIRAKWGAALRTFNPGTTTLASGFNRQENANWVSAGLGEVIPGIATGPVGGEEEISFAQATLPTPVISPDTQVLPSAQSNMEVVITCDDPAATVRYTTDGSAPSAASPEYTAPFTLNVQPDQFVTVSAKAFKDDEFSNTAKATYRVAPNAAPVFSAESCTGITQSFALKLYAAPGADIYYALNGGSYVPYISPITVSATTTVAAYVSGGGLSKSDTVQRTYGFIGTTDDVLMYHNFSTLNGVTAANYTNIALSTGLYTPFSANRQSLAMTITDSQNPSDSQRNVSIAPEAGGALDVTGYDYLIIWIYAPADRNDTLWIKLNSQAGAWTNTKGGGAQWVSVVIPRNNQNGDVNWPGGMTSFTNITIGEWNAATYNIECIYFAKSPTAVPPPSVKQICQAVVAPVGAQEYTGDRVEPELTVTFGGQPLTLGMDYTVEYSNNIGPGAAYAKITGMDAYAGTITEQFIIGEPPPPANDAPIFSAAGCTGITQPFTLKLYAAPNTEIWYMLDTGGYVLYDGPITISATTTVTAYASGGEKGKSDIVQNTYKFADDILMYHDFTTTTGITAGNDTSITLNTGARAPASLNTSCLNMVTTSSGWPWYNSETDKMRSISIPPEGGGSVNAAGYNYLVIWINAPNSGTVWVQYNTGAGAGEDKFSNASGVPGYTESKAGTWTPIVLERGKGTWTSTLNDFSKIFIGEWNPGTYQIDSIYFANAPNAVPPTNSSKPICQADVAPIANQTYTGDPIEPTLTVTYGDTPLILGMDYTVEYENNTDVGTAYAIITGMDGYAGTVTEPFVIESAGGVSVTGKVRSYNPGNPTTIELMRGDTVEYATVIDPAPALGSGQQTQSFIFTDVEPGEYSLVITKDAHTSFKVQKIIVGSTDLNLAEDSRDAVKEMTLLCGDISGDDMINDGDLAILWLAANYNKSAGAPGVDKLCDLNGDGMINDSDLAILWLAVNYNKGAVTVP